MDTNIISTKTHGYIDHITAGTLLMLPLLLSGKKKGAETYIPMILGAGVLVQSLLTNYESGVKDKLSMRTHLIMDVANGVLMALSPFIFGFRKKSWAPHLAIGVMELVIAGLSRSGNKRRR